MLKSNEILTLYAIIDKAETHELRDIILLCTDEVIRRKETELYNNPIFTQSEERIKNTESEKYEQGNT